MDRKTIEKLTAIIDSGIEGIAEKAAQTNRIDPSEVDLLKKALCVKAMLAEDMGGGQSMRGSYDGNSYRRGRDHDTGQFVSRSETGWGSRQGGSYGSYENGRSGHSAGDRLRSMIEEFGESGGEAERKAAEKFLQSMR